MPANTHAPHRTLFLAAAAFNVVAGLALVAHPLWFDLLGIVPHPENTFFLALFVCLVLTFGYGYYLAAGDFASNRAIVKLGAIGKLLVFTTALIYLIAGRTSWHLPVVTIADLVFAVLFIRALRMTMT